MPHAAPAPLDRAADVAQPPDHQPGIQCLNCHQALAGPFCHHCGQAASTPERITNQYLLHQLLRSILDVDHGVIYIVREMLWRPGATIRRYLSGERKPFFSPLSLLFIVGGISVLLFEKLDITSFNAEQPAVPVQVQRAQNEMMHVVEQYQTWIAVLLLPVSASIATPILRHATGYSWAEQVVVAALLSSAISTVSLLSIPAMAYWSGKPGYGYLVTVISLGSTMYKAWGYAQLQAVTAGPTRPGQRWARALLIAAGDYAATTLLIGLLLVVIMLIRH